MEKKRPLIKKKLTATQMRERDAELVKGRFVFYEVPGGTLNFSYKKYKGDPVRSYSLKDGEIYNVPRGVARHLVSSGSYPVHEYQTDESGKPVVRIGRRKRRYGFESLEFFDDISESSNIVTAEKVI